MLILSMIRNFLPAHKQIVDGGWDIGAAASKAYDLQNKVVGTVGTGRIGQLVLARLKVSIAETLPVTAIDIMPRQPFTSCSVHQLLLEQYPGCFALVSSCKSSQSFHLSPINLRQHAMTFVI